MRFGLHFFLSFPSSPAFTRSLTPLHFPFVDHAPEINLPTVLPLFSINIVRFMLVPFPKHIPAAYSSLSSLSFLQFLDFHSCHITAMNCASLAASFGHPHNLKALDLSDNSLGREGLFCSCSGSDAFDPTHILAIISVQHQCS